MALRAKKNSKREEGAPDYMLTYGDMVTLLLVFFVTMFSLNDIIVKENILRIMSASFSGSGFFKGGKTLDVGKLSYLSNSFMSLPSTEKNKQASQTAKNKSMIEFIEKIQSKSIIVRRLERGVVVSLLADAFFDSASAEVKLDENRRAIQRIASFIGFLDDQGYNFKIEGHTDNVDTDVNGIWKSNWELSAVRAVNMLEQILNYADQSRIESIESRFEVSGFAGSRPIATDDTPEGRAYNRRIDILITSDSSLSTPKSVN
ncbi:flagellar motor protein MotB [Candidatus Borreliella tachyglossi]|uniref:Flagellar motor protein MotB n=1 Tax=Candidatus Borreliella tachyglossi TaxID=1964448 RepID=A0A2S1LWM0_9SPIR|nr:flagellar motor protein MotB [Candidatus Borreliella tachyglossi]AWG42670.1 flagellar motor protein MotB [Candidatus Borreliella tachyglossi]